jgi:hypothetical protein
MSANLHLGGAAPRGAVQMTPTPRNPGEAAFDRWLNRELTRLYDDAMSEPVPEDLLKLIDGTAKK